MPHEHLPHRAPDRRDTDSRAPGRRDTGSRAPDRRDALITGVGLISCLGEGLDAHWAALTQPDGFVPVVDETTFAPFSVHPMCALELDKQVPKRGDQRQMEAWQRIGTYAAGLALDSAGVKGNAELLGRMDMIVAAGGGERDCGVDTAILSALPKQDDPGAYLNEHLLGDLRPTLFLAQLSNLLAGNISIVHGVTGSSRTFMGEETAGADAVRIACRRIAAGQGEIALVGGSYNAQRPDILLEYEMGRALWKHPFAAVGDRQARGGGMVLGSVGCFLVIESRSHAQARGAVGLARIAAIATDRCRRRPGEATANATRQLAAMGALERGSAAVISAASGIGAPTAEELAFLDGLGLPVRATGTALGHSMEPVLPANLALAAVSLRHGRLFGPLEPMETPMQGSLSQVLVTGWGHWRGEAMALVMAAG
jgi:3-oxoacyl-[acyl-carrier-protein] synthase II